MKGPQFTENLRWRGGGNNLCVHDEVGSKLSQKCLPGSASRNKSQNVIISININVNNNMKLVFPQAMPNLIAHIKKGVLEMEGEGGTIEVKAMFGAA